MLCLVCVIYILILLFTSAHLEIYSFHTLPLCALWFILLSFIHSLSSFSNLEFLCFIQFSVSQIRLVAFFPVPLGQIFVTCFLLFLFFNGGYPVIVKLSRDCPVHQLLFSHDMPKEFWLSFPYISPRRTWFVFWPTRVSAGSFSETSCIAFRFSFVCVL